MVDKIKDWSEKFKAPLNDKFTVDPKQVALGIDLLMEELKELKAELYDTHNIKSNDDIDQSKVTKEFIDVLWSNVRLGLTLGIDIQEGVDKVYASNMSKSVPQSKLQQSLEALHAKFPKDTIYVASYVNKTGTVMFTFFNKKGKILKGIDYEEAKF
jgi:NTP pyrophosphatase (non-canonical NTP hydrolase)